MQQADGGVPVRYEEFYEKIPVKLNKQQQEAVRAVEGPVLLLAVPGSGKTTVLVTRLGYMVYCVRIAPENILTLTYTVAAVNDMDARFRSYFGDELGGRLEFRTMNGICARIIQYYGRRIGREAFSLITEDKIIAGILSDIYKRVEGGYASESELKGIRAMIAYIKNMMLTDVQIKELDKETDYSISEIYKEYCGELRRLGRMDYDDQMVYAYAILRKSPEVLQHFQNQYPYICVDEAQDTSKIQHAVIGLLAGRTNNLFMVGDEDQSIYGFRAAYPEALLSFEKNYPGARVLLMEDNFRSNAKITKAADFFIQKNTLRHEKHMKAAREAGDDIREIALKGRGAQYEYLVKAAKNCRRQTAVLYRDNESVLPLVDLLERQGIPYRIRSKDLAFFTHRVVLDIQNIILFSMNPKDTDLFLKIYYKLSTYIDKESAIRICEISEKNHMEVLEAAVRYGRLQDRTEQSCRAVWAHLKRLGSERGEEALDRIVRSMGYGEYLKRAGIGDSKLFLLRAIARNEDLPGRLVDRLGELQAIIREKTDDRDVKFILSTIHASKGLEYDRVYLMDIADGIFPEAVPKNHKSMDPMERESYEEERRLFYVGVTRARNLLCILKWGSRSVFCEELIYHGEKAAEKPLGPQSVPVFFQEKEPFHREEFMKFYSSVRAGQAVTHQKFGEGVIVEVNESTAVIRFGSQCRKFGMKVLFENKLLSF